DLAQDALFRAYLARGTYQPGTCMRAWVTRILLNQHLNDVRREAMRPEAVGDGIDAVPERAAAREGKWVSDVATAGSMDARMRAYGERLGDEARDAFYGVPFPHRAAFYLFVVEGHSYAEVAGQLGIPVGTVMSRIHRARTSLRTSLAGYAPGRA
ncbi:MAG TPA: sigma-70 family RNA polymerase sigma factor, partial [archaeon]|nr:sigma-70 family RNA polymerase sigma factor [archaeon]